MSHEYVFHISMSGVTSHETCQRNDCCAILIITIFNIFNNIVFIIIMYLRVRVAVVWLKPEAVDLPEHHAKGPDVGLCGKLSVQDALRRHPPYRQQRLSLYSEIKVCIFISISIYYIYICKDVSSLSVYAVQNELIDVAVQNTFRRPILKYRFNFSCCTLFVLSLL